MVVGVVDSVAMVRHQCGLVVLDPWDIVVEECCVEIDQPLRPGGEEFTVEFTLRNDEQVPVKGSYHTYVVDTDTGEKLADAFGHGHWELDSGESKEYEVTSNTDDLGLDVEELVGDEDKVVLGTVVETDDHEAMEDEIKGA